MSRRIGTRPVRRASEAVGLGISCLDWQTDRWNIIIIIIIVIIIIIIIIIIFLPEVDMIPREILLLL